MNKFKRITSLTVAVLFFINNLSYGLSIQPGMTQKGTRDAMDAMGERTFADQNLGPGSVKEGLIDILENFTPTNEEPVLESAKLKKRLTDIKNMYGSLFVEEYYFDGGEVTYCDDAPAIQQTKNNHPFLKEDDPVKALKEFFKRAAGYYAPGLTDEEKAKIEKELARVDIVEASFPVKPGTITMTMLQPVEGGRFILYVHPEFVRMWKHIKANDAWFKCSLRSGGREEERYVSLSQGILTAVARHYMTDWEDAHIDGRSKNKGHLNFLSAEEGFDDPYYGEIDTNYIGGLYEEFNEVAILWFAGSYGFNNSTRLDNDILFERCKDFFTGKLDRPATGDQYKNRKNNEKKS